MEPIRLGARVDHSSLDDLEAGFADRVTPRALFLSRTQLTDGIDVAVGARVHVEILLCSGEPGLVVEGVVAWSISDKTPPPGREPGIGVAITAVDDVTEARLRRMATQPGAGVRVRVPGQRLADRLRLGAAMIPPGPVVAVIKRTTTPPGIPAPVFIAAPQTPAPLPAAPARPTSAPPPKTPSRPTFASLFPQTEPLPSSRPTGGTLRPRLMSLLADGDGDVGSSDVIDLPAPAPFLAPGAERADAKGNPADGAVRPEGKDFLEAPTLPSFSSSSSDGLASLPDALSPFGDDALSAQGARPFESQSTDVDLLASISASDIIGHELAALQARTEAANVDEAEGFTAPATNADQQWRDVDDLPSAEADLLPHEPGEWELQTDHSDRSDEGWGTLPTGETLVLEPRSLPEPGAWPQCLEPVEALERLVGVFCSFSRRGLADVEPFAWPAGGTKRFSKVEPAPLVDSDVFAGSGDVEQFSGPPELDPFAGSGTDPRLNVEGVVARAVRAARGESEGDVFSNSQDEATGEELRLPVPELSSGDGDDTDRELRRPPSKAKR